MKTLLLSQLINIQEADALLAYKAIRQDVAPQTLSTQQIVMTWLSCTKEGRSVMGRMDQNGVIPEYGAYLLEYYVIMPNAKQT